MKRIFMNRIGRRQFIKTSLSGLALVALPRISFAQSNPDVVVIGGGSSGLAATAELMKQGKSVICIDAMSRKGGRAYTDHSIFGIPYDMGCHWLHNFSGNHLAKWGKKQKNLTIYKLKEKYVVYEGDKRIKGMKMGSLWGKLENLLYSEANAKKDVPFWDLIPQKLKEKPWFDSAQQAIGACSPARDLNNLTPNDDWENWTGKGKGDGFCTEGYGTLLHQLRKDVPVKVKTIAKEIKWDGDGVKVETNEGTISAKACIVTVSQGVLGSGKIKFTPALPNIKYEAFDGITMGSYNHITFQLKDEFYEEFKIKPDAYLSMRIESNIGEPSFSPKGSCATMRNQGTNISYFDVGGQFGKDLEAEGSEASIDFIKNRLRKAFGSDFDKYFIKAHVTAWGKNPWVMGSYSGAIPGKAKLRKVLKESVGDKIFFAGEATSGQYATCHGADLTGTRAAKELIKKAKVAQWFINSPIKKAS